MCVIDLSEIRAEMETEREWREREMRFFRNHIATLDSEDERRVARKALVLMLYAHFEGTCKSLLSIYVNRLNGLGLKVSEVVPALGASTLADVFHGLRDPNRKCPEFARALPDDSALHRFARDREFVEVVWKIGERDVSIPVDTTVDTESNLKPVVLRKILYRLGLDPSQANQWEGSIHLLLNLRNNIAHGVEKNGLSAEDYEKLEVAVRQVIEGLVKSVSDVVTSRVYLASGAKP